MADEPQSMTEGGRRRGFVKELSGATAKKALAGLVAAAATAGTTYLARKSTRLWQEKLGPKVREKGGGRAVAKGALEKVSEKVGARRSDALAALMGRVRGTSTNEKQDQKPRPKARREEERRQRKQRREQRRRALDRSSPT
jgi:hypothetical protein